MLYAPPGPTTGWISGGDAGRGFALNQELENCVLSAFRQLINDRAPARFRGVVRCSVTAGAGIAGGVAERFKAHAWKACWGESPSGVRIPVPPPYPLKSGHLWSHVIPRLSLVSWDDPGKKDFSSPLPSSSVHGIMWGQLWRWIVSKVRFTS